MDKGLSDFELFDISDVTYDFVKTKQMREVTLVMKSATAFNLMKYYLALKEYVERMENELGVMESTGDFQ